MTLLHIHHEALAESAGLGHVLLSAFEESIYICFLVIVMMTLIEIFNVSSKGRIFKGLERHRFGQAVVSAGLGMLPGCLGGFAGVSLYSHRIIGFGALIAMLIATTGDEAFLMLAMFPREAVFMMLGLFVGGVTIGYIVDIVVRYMQRRGRWMSLGADRPADDNFEIHACDCEHHHKHHSADSGHHAGESELHSEAHSARAAVTEQVETPSANTANPSQTAVEDCEPVRKTTRSRSQKVAHFLNEHLWKHVIKRHLPTIFCWTFGVLALFGILSMYIDLETWIKGNTWLMIILAVIIGLIPESGPHMIFVTMFASGVLPFHVLLANSIAQDGHACLPLLAENKRSFVLAKGVKSILALVVGFVAMFLGNLI